VIVISNHKVISLL